MPRRRCYRSLDETIVGIWGLEPLDLIVVVVGTTILSLVLGPLGILAGAAFMVGLIWLKAGKPRGYVFYLLYRLGFVRFCPETLRPPNLIVPPLPVGQRVFRFSGSAGPEDDESADAKFFQGSKNPRE